MGQSYLEKETGNEEDDTRWTELHVLHEDLAAEEGALPDGDGQVDEAPHQDHELTPHPDLLYCCVKSLP